MYQSRTGYDRGVNTFSPEGRLFQVEYAVKSIEHGYCAIGVRTSEGVVLASERNLSSVLLEQSSVEKIFEIDSHMGAAVSGLVADARTLIDHARVETQNHRFSYDEPMRIESLTQSICDLKMSFGEDRESKKSKMSRPFGVSMLIAGVDECGPQLFHTDPSGSFLRYDAHAIGGGSEGATSVLQEKYNKSMTLDEAIYLVVRVMADAMEAKLSTSTIELATVTPAKGFRIHTADELTPVIERALAEAAAEAA